MRIAYFVHNLADPAVGKRVRMLASAGDEVHLLGFRRDEKIVDYSGVGVKPVDLGRTLDRNFAQRAVMVLKRCIGVRAWAESIRNCDVIMARNLEMLALAVATRRKFAPGARLVYECLDIHRLLLSKRIWGVVLRAIERTLMRKANLLVISAPAFMSEYFEPRQGVNHGLRLPVLLVENKVLPALDGIDMPRPVSDPPSGPPWRIGWFGMIRCRKSLDLLCDLALRHPHLIHLTIRGRPSRVEFENFDAQVDRAPGISFGGLYDPSELETLYGDVHFNWAIDYFEEDANSSWLLPNRIYEGGAYNAVPIALNQTETARWLKAHGIGVVLGSADRALEAFLLQLTPACYDELKQASRAVPRSAFIADDRDSARLLEALRKATSSSEQAIASPAGTRSPLIESAQ
ncbi:MAG TPA: glycosyl transferase family 1 [Stellaceae bacterium]|nr:glycosyl transferase family 1 [Stellaceae bacterium]